jgi:hypothetical protein
MIIGKLSIDPRRVIASLLTQEHGRYTLTVKISVDGGVMEIDDYFTSESEARRYQEELDSASYKAPLVDAISNKEITEEDDYTITEALIRAIE